MVTCVSGDNPKEMHALWFEPVDNESRCRTCIKPLFVHAPHYVPHFAHFSHFSFLMWLIVCAYRVHASCTCRKCRHSPQPPTTTTHYNHSLQTHTTIPVTPAANGNTASNDFALSQHLMPCLLLSFPAQRLQVVTWPHPQLLPPAVTFSQLISA